MRIHAPRSRLGQLRTPIHLAVLTLCAGAAQAQTQAAVPAPAASAASAPTTSLETVTVTATKRVSPLQRTPVAITSLSSSRTWFTLYRASRPRARETTVSSR
jgi:outer membrane receptor protein involved in Fe transport